LYLNIFTLLFSLSLFVNCLLSISLCHFSLTVSFLIFSYTIITFPVSGSSVYLIHFPFIFISHLRCLMSMFE
jgi:hypothetical protein